MNLEFYDGNNVASYFNKIEGTKYQTDSNVVTRTINRNGAVCSRQYTEQELVELIKDTYNGTTLSYDSSQQIYNITVSGYAAVENIVKDITWVGTNEGEILQCTDRDLKDSCPFYTVWSFKEKQVGNINYEQEDIFNGTLHVKAGKEGTIQYAEKDIELRKKIQSSEAVDSSPLLEQVGINFIWEGDPINPITPVESGAFPSGIDASCLVLLCNTNALHGLSLKDLNDYTNTYNQNISHTSDNYTYFGQDSNGMYIYLNKSKVIESTKEVPSDQEHNEILNDWSRLYGEDAITGTDGLQNAIENVKGTDCYKVYVRGTCQAIDVNARGIITLSGDGSTELSCYSFPLGYYIIVNKTLNLYILERINRIDWNLDNKNDRDEYCATYNEDGEPIGRAQNYKEGQAEGTAINIEGRKSYKESRIGHHIYIGTMINTSVDNPIIGTETGGKGISYSDSRGLMSGADNLRQVIMSDSITEISYIGTNANPDSGYVYSNNLTYLGPEAVGSSASTFALIGGTKMQKIADHAFGANANTKIYLCDNPKDYGSIQQLGNHYTFQLKPEYENTLGNGLIQLGSSVKFVGDEAFKNVHVDRVDLSACDPFELYIGVESFAVDTSVKVFYLKDSLFANGSNDLLYLPDEFYNINNQTYEFKYNGSQPQEMSSSSYNGNNYPNAANKRTFGTRLSGYKFYNFGGN